MSHEDTAAEFDKKLAPYAVRHDNSKGRQFKETLSRGRNEFERDLSRIIHSTALRKLQYKTQVFANHEGDLFRTRLTHSMEVAQVARSVARELRLNETLAETLALSHDLGHAPFGHVGQDVLNELMESHGGFEHNLHGLKIVDSIEKPYVSYDGLNLLFEAREGILKHCSIENAKDLGLVGQRFLHGRPGGDDKYVSPSLEAQIVDISDSIAYTHADIEDGIRMGILKFDQVRKAIPQFEEGWKAVKQQNPDIVHRKSTELRIVRVICGIMMKRAIADLVDTTAANIKESGISSIEDVRATKKLAGFSPEMKAEHTKMKSFLRQNLYTHPDVDQVRDQQREVLCTIFSSYEKNPKLMQDAYDPSSSVPLHRQICDHMAGMTDRFAVAELTRLKELKAKRSAGPRFGGRLTG